MPIFRFSCGTAVCDGRVFQKLLARGELDGWLRDRICAGCRRPIMRAPTGPGVKMVQVLDNGVMPRAVERPEDIQHLLDEDAEKGDRT